MTSGSGKVTLTRLLEGVYPSEEAYPRLEAIRKTADAFVMPENGNLAIYVGSFQNPQKANAYAQVLAKKKIEVTLVTVEIEMPGHMLLVQPVERPIAQSLSEQMAQLGLTAKMIPPIDEMTR